MKIDAELSLADLTDSQTSHEFLSFTDEQFRSLSTVAQHTNKESQKYQPWR